MVDHIPSMVEVAKNLYRKINTNIFVLVRKTLMFELDNFVYALHMDNCLNGDFFFLFFAGITLLLGVGFVICGILVLLFFRGFVDDYIKSVSSQFSSHNNYRSLAYMVTL